VTENLLAIRESIHALQIEAAGIEFQWRSRDHVQEAVHEGVRGGESEAHTLPTLQRLAAGQPAPLLTVKAMTPHGTVSIDLLPIFIKVLGAPAVTKSLLRGLDDIPVGLNPDARATRLETIKTELHRLETSEESTIREAENAGEAIARRPEADPRCVLAL
jgi:hypothetical protein